MTEMPAAETERNRRTPGPPLSADSSGNVTSSSTSSGAIPWASVMTVTVGAERSGKTSTGMWRREKRMRRFSMTGS
jgi:hypothetical protein